MPSSNHAAQNDFPSGLSEPARRALAGAGIQNLQQLSTHSETQIKKLHGMGPKGIDLLKKALLEKGLAFASSPK
jgi:DNA-directed RNA polymerase alpha subunit